jgi:hypothetical protein
MDENKKTKYFINFTSSGEEYDLEEIKDMIENNPDMKKLGIVLLLAKNKLRH